MSKGKKVKEEEPRKIKQVYIDEDGTESTKDEDTHHEHHLS